MMSGNIVFRDCVDKLLNECSMKTFTDQEVRVKVCYNSCADDGCNNKAISASSAGASRTLPVGGRVTALLLVCTVAVASVSIYIPRHQLCHV